MELRIAQAAFRQLFQHWRLYESAERARSSEADVIQERDHEDGTRRTRSVDATYLPAPGHFVGFGVSPF